MYSHKSFFVENDRIVWKVKTAGGAIFHWTMILGGSENQVPNRIRITTHQGSQVHHPYYEGDTHLKLNMWILNMMILKGWKYIYILINYVLYTHTHSALQNIASLVYINPPPHQIGTNWAGMNIEVSAARPAVRTESAAELAGIRLANDLSCWGKNYIIWGKNNSSHTFIQSILLLGKMNQDPRELGCYGCSIECEWLVAFKTWDLTKGTCHGAIHGRVFFCLSTDR